MGKFDPKKEKIPKSKDRLNFKNFLSDKYLHKKFASRDIEKELSLITKEKNPDNKNISDPNSSSDDSSTPGNNITPGENMFTPESKSNLESIEEKDKKKLENLEVNHNPLLVNDKNAVIYPRMTANLLESPSSPGVECQVFKENGQNDRNLFFFENFNTPCDNNVDINDWGFIWDNENKQKSAEKDTNNLEELDKPEYLNIKNNEDIFNLIKEKGSDTTKDHSIEGKKADWEFPVEFDLVSHKTNTTTSSNTSPDYIASLSQNLNGIYNHYSNTNSNTNTNNKKTFDDLERYLSDSAFMTPAGKKPVAVPLQVGNTPITVSTTSNYTPINNFFPLVAPQMMMNYSYNINQVNNNYQMHSQNHTDYFTTNVRETNNNYNHSFKNHYVGSNYRNTVFCSTPENLDNSFNLLNLNTQQQLSDQNSYNTASSQSNSIKYDVFKDIYNYSKNNKNTSNNKPCDNLSDKSSINGTNPSNQNNSINNPFDF